MGVHVSLGECSFPGGLIRPRPGSYGFGFRTEDLGFWGIDGTFPK